MKWLFLVALLTGCATSRVPYTSEIATGNWSGDWFGDGAPKVLRVTNPLDRPVTAYVNCAAPDGSTDYWYTNVEAHGEVNALIQTLNRDQYVNVCHVAAWTRLLP